MAWNHSGHGLQRFANLHFHQVQTRYSLLPGSFLTRYFDLPLSTTRMRAIRAVYSVTDLLAQVSKFKVPRHFDASLPCRSYHDARARAASIFHRRENAAGTTRAIWPKAALRAKYFPSARRSLDFVAMPSRQFLRGWLLTMLA